jgi:hypothetical protein
MTPKKKGRHGGKKLGRRASPIGKQASPVKDVAQGKLALHQWRLKTRKLVLTLAAFQGTGTPYDEGKCNLALHVTLKCVDKAALTWDTEADDVRGLAGAFGEAAELTGMSKSKIRELFNSFLESEGATFIVGDNTTRGRASENCDRTKLHNTHSCVHQAPKFLQGLRLGSGAGVGGRLDAAVLP